MIVLVAFTWFPGFIQNLGRLQITANVYTRKVTDYY